MNDTQARKDGIFGDPGRIAPHLDKKWRDEFILEMRFLDVPGDRIGDALVTADSHVQESGESALEAFGDPKAYAQETAQAYGHLDDAGMRAKPRDVFGMGIGVLGMFATSTAFAAWLEGTGVPVTVGGALAFAVMLILVAAVTRWSEPILRLAVEHTMLVAILAPILLLGTFVGLYLLFPHTLVDLSALAVGLVGVVALAISSWLVWTDPEVDGDEIVAPGQVAKKRDGARLFTALVLPGFTLALMVFSLIGVRLT